MSRSNCPQQPFGGKLKLLGWRLSWWSWSYRPGHLFVGARAQAYYVYPSVYERWREALVDVCLLPTLTLSMRWRRRDQPEPAATPQPAESDLSLLEE